MPTVIESILYSHVSVLERRQLKKILEELSFQYSDLSDIEKAKKVGRMLGADFLIVGEIQQCVCKVRGLGGYNTTIDYLNLRVVDIEIGRNLQYIDV